MKDRMNWFSTSLLIIAFVMLQFGATPKTKKVRHNYLKTEDYNPPPPPCVLDAAGSSTCTYSYPGGREMVVAGVNVVCRNQGNVDMCQATWQFWVEYKTVKNTWVVINGTYEKYTEDYGPCGAKDTIAAGYFPSDYPNLITRCRLVVTSNGNYLLGDETCYN